MAATKKAKEDNQVSASAEAKKRTGRKGGTEYPRIPLAAALEYSDKLVSKTHTGPQPANVILPGVFNNSGGGGRIRAASLRKYGLLKGEKSAISATDLAKSINAAASDEEKTVLLRKAVMSDKVFGQLFDTFHGDTVTKAKIRQRAQALKVHPDQSDECADFFIQSAETAKLGGRDGDGIRLISSSDISLPLQDEPDDETEVEPNEAAGGNGDQGTKSETLKEPEGAKSSERPSGDIGTGEGYLGKTTLPRPRMAADVNVSLTVDSSLDGEKLEKQLAALRRYGLI